MLEARYGDVVTIRFTGRLASDGTTFDSTDDDEPFEFEVGSEDVVPGISRAVLGMKAGDKKSVQLKPEDAYGERDEELIQEVDREDLPDDVEVGDELQATTEDDEETIVWVREVNDEGGIIDGNHPLAGETLDLEIEMISVDRDAG